MNQHQQPTPKTMKLLLQLIKSTTLPILIEEEKKRGLRKVSEGIQNRKYKDSDSFEISTND